MLEVWLRRFMLKEMVKKALDEGTDKILKNMNYQMGKLRTGRANPTILDGILVDYFGSQVPIKQVAQISNPEARLLQIQPFDRSMIANIERAIQAANIGVTPLNDGNVIRIPFPALTEEKRKLIVKDVKKMVEDAKIGVRNIRRDQIEIIKKAEKDKKISEDESKKIQADFQLIVDKYIKQLDDISSAIEKELMTI